MPYKAGSTLSQRVGYFARIEGREGPVMMPPFSFGASYKGNRNVIPVLHHMGRLPVEYIIVSSADITLKDTAGEKKYALMPISGMNDSNGSALSVRRTRSLNVTKSGNTT